jgi:hypothetical protein
MKAVEFQGRILPDGHLEIPASAQRELGLHSLMQVRVILLKDTVEGDGPTSHEQDKARRRHEAIQDLLALRNEFAGMDFNLTEVLLQTREAEGE